jgi:hypothetical protein
MKALCFACLRLSQSASAWLYRIWARGLGTAAALSAASARGFAPGPHPVWGRHRRAAGLGGGAPAIRRLGIYFAINTPALAS